MPEKKIVQDIVTHRTIRNVPIRRMESPKEAPKEAPARKVHKTHPPGRKKMSFTGIIFTFLVVFFSIAVIAVALSLLYTKASVTITPKVANFEIKGNSFTAKKNPTAAATAVSGLAYEVLSKSDSQSQTITATDGPRVETKAKGTVLLFNEQKTGQKIIAGTRISNAEGLIYRTTATVVIPAMATSAGSIAVEVVADKAGSQYNMPAANSEENLKIVAYKGTDKYATVYSRLKTAISGGFSGNKKIISEDLQKSTVAEMEKTLKSKLAEQVKTLVPSGYILYDGATATDFEVSEPAGNETETATITVKGSIYAVIFKKDSLVKSIAGKELDKFPAPTYEIQGMENLAFGIVNSKDFSAKKGTPLIFSLNGPITLVGTFSEAALRTELVGTYLKESNDIFSRYPSISNAYALITPFWMRTFPNSPENIRLEIKN